jgi:hypothetical protein
LFLLTFNKLLQNRKIHLICPEKPDIGAFMEHD